MERQDMDIGESAQEVKYRDSRKKKEGTNHSQNSRIIHENFTELKDKSIQVERVHRAPGTIGEHRTYEDHNYDILEHWAQRDHHISFHREEKLHRKNGEYL